MISCLALAFGIYPLGDGSEEYRWQAFGFGIPPVAFLALPLLLLAVLSIDPGDQRALSVEMLVFVLSPSFCSGRIRPRFRSAGDSWPAIWRDSLLRERHPPTAAGHCEWGAPSSRCRSRPHGRLRRLGPVGPEHAMCLMVRCAPAPKDAIATGRRRHWQRKGLMMRSPFPMDRASRRRVSRDLADCRTGPTMRGRE